MDCGRKRRLEAEKGLRNHTEPTRLKVSVRTKDLKTRPRKGTLQSPKKVLCKEFQEESIMVRKNDAVAKKKIKLGGPNRALGSHKKD